MAERCKAPAGGCRAVCKRAPKSRAGCNRGRVRLRYARGVAPRERKELTVLVLGRPGATTQPYRIGRLAIVLLAMVLPCSGLAVGYVLGHQHGVGIRTTTRRSLS